MSFRQSPMKSKIDTIIELYREQLTEMSDKEIDALIDKQKSIDITKPAEDQVWRLVNDWCEGQKQAISYDQRLKLMDLISNLAGVRATCSHTWITDGVYVGETSVRKCTKCDAREIV